MAVGLTVKRRNMFSFTSRICKYRELMLVGDLRRPIDDHGEHMTHVNGKCFQVWIRQTAWFVHTQIFIVFININNAIFHLHLIIEVLWNILHTVRVLSLTRAGTDICGEQKG